MLLRRRKLKSHGVSRVLIKVKEWILINDRRQNLCKEWVFTKKTKGKVFIFLLKQMRLWEAARSLLGFGAEPRNFFFLAQNP